MNNAEIAAELRKRAEELRALPPGAWVPHMPEVEGQECAIMAGPIMAGRVHRWRVMSIHAQCAATRWLSQRGIAAELAQYNDTMAFDQHDVANVLDKIAEDIS